jgi:hypothetical protein
MSRRFPICKFCDALATLGMHFLVDKRAGISLKIRLSAGAGQVRIPFRHSKGRRGSNNAVWTNRGSNPLPQVEVAYGAVGADCSVLILLRFGD